MKGTVWVSCNRATAHAAAVDQLKEALANVQELLDTPLLQHSNELVDNFTKHLRSVYGQSKRALSRDYLDATVERMLLEHGIPRPVRQFEVEIDGRVRRLDLAWPEAKVGVEAHSKLIHFGAAVEDDDNHRDLELAAAGWEVLYLTWKIAHQPEFFLRALRAVLARRLPPSAAEH